MNENTENPNTNETRSLLEPRTLIVATVIVTATVIATKTSMEVVSELVHRPLAKFTAKLEKKNEELKNKK